MKKQVIAKINNIANQLDSNGYYVEANVLTNVMKKLAFDRDFDEEGSYDEMFGPMNDDPDEDEEEEEEIQTPSKTGLISVNKFGENFLVGLTIDSTRRGEFRGTENEDGVFEPFKSADEANRFAVFLKVKHRDVKFKMNLYDPNRPKTYFGDPGAEAYERDRDRRSSY